MIHQIKVFNDLPSAVEHSIYVKNHEKMNYSDGEINLNMVDLITVSGYCLVTVFH